MFVEVDSVSCMSGGGGEGKHEVRNYTCLGVQNPKSTGIEAELCNEEGMIREEGDANGVGDEVGDDVVGICRKGAIPIGPVGQGCVYVVVVENVAAQEVGYLLDEALREERQFGVPVSYSGEYGGDVCLDVDQLGIEVFPGKGWRTNRGAKEAETSSEFSGEWRAEDIDVICFGGIARESVRD